MLFRYAVSRTTDSRWPVPFRDDCERTPFDSQTGEDKTLMEVIVELDALGYDLVGREELERRFGPDGKRKESEG